MASTISSPEGICGIWDDADDMTGQEISSFIKANIGQDVIRADLNNLSFIKDGTNNRHYFVLVSKKSMKDHKVMLFMTSVLYQLYNVKLITKVLLIVIDESIEERHFPINLRLFDRVTALSPITEDHVTEICQKLQELPMSIQNSPSTGNVGIGMAWSYFYGYLAMLLPGMKDRIVSSKVIEDNERICTKFIIIIPESCQTPATVTDADQRLSTVGPLDDGIQKSRAGHPSRLYKTFLHKIKNVKVEDECYFCGEFATPVLALRKMVESGIMDEKEMGKQRVLFKHTLMAILNHKRNPDCYDRAIVHDYADEKEGASLADELSKLIHDAGKRDPLSRSSSVSSTESFSSMSTIVSIPSLTIIRGSDEAALLWDESLTSFCVAADQEYGITVEVDPNGLQCYSVQTHYSLEELHPKLKPTDDLINADQIIASEKLLIILTESNEKDITSYADLLIKHEIWFPRTTIIVDLPNIPGWLEASKVDYIDTRKYTKCAGNLWKRLFGSLFGTAAVEGMKDCRWKDYDVGMQYQTDRLPIGDVAHGLAWGYYLNYLDLIGPSMGGRIEKEEYFKQGKMPKMLFILLPDSCYSYPTLEKADPAITSAGKLETLNIQIAGNFRNYETAVHEISSNGQTYYACVEYCTPVLVMYEMEAEGKAGLSPGQKEAQLLAFRHVLQDKLDHSEYKQQIKLISYDDQSRKLSDVLVENIKKSLEV